MRADADLMVWLHGRPESVQRAVRALRRDAFADAAELVWSSVGMHRPAEFNKGHVPAFMAGAPAQDWAVVYPFVRSYEWYLLPEVERRALLVEHGTMGPRLRVGPLQHRRGLRARRLQWVLALEAPQAHDIVDLMRHLRASGARRHVLGRTPSSPAGGSASPRRSTALR